MPHLPCSKIPPLTYTKNYGDYFELRIDRSALKSYSPNGVTCCYSAIHRGNDAKKPDDVISIGPCKEFSTPYANVTDEFIMVKCFTKHRKKEVYKNVHASTLVREDLKKKFVKKKNEELPLSVLMIGIDSISR